MKLWTTKVTRMLVQLNINQLDQNRIINMNRISVDEKLWQINQLLNPSALQVKYDDLSNEYAQLLAQYSKLYEEWSALSPYSDKVTEMDIVSAYPKHIIDEENNHV